MQLLLEQKQELDDLREKGIELETATAVTAAAATATAMKAKEHEKRSTVMFSQTEELMKFQFMTMSMSYFSSLNMLKQLRDMNSDTTSAAIAASAGITTHTWPIDQHTLSKTHILNYFYTPLPLPHT